MRARATLHTVGYQKRSLPEMLTLLASKGVGILVDVRETAWSHKPGFSKGALTRGCEEAGIRYVHLRAAGNPKALRRTAIDHADCLAKFEAHLEENPSLESLFDAEISVLLQLEKGIALMCFERHPGDCHRGILAERWAERRRGRVNHLDPAGCDRLLPV